MHVVVLLLLAVSSALIFSCAVDEPECIGSRVARILKVSQSSSNEGDFKTIQDAVDAVPTNNDRWTKINVSPGVYREKVAIPMDKPCIVLEGKGASNTIVTYDAYGKADESATFISSASNFKAVKIGFRNSAGLKSGRRVGPANAIRVYGNKSTFYKCGFVGYQDTILDSTGRHYFKSCYIEGAVDFIWGNGQSVYEGCKINVTGGGYITAQSRDSAEDTTGFVFIGCSVSGNAKTYLGRAHRPHARVIYRRSQFSDIIQPEGWLAWSAGGQETNTVYAESKCLGPGASMSGRVGWEKNLTSSELSQYTLSAFVDQDGWIAKQPQ